MASFVGQIAQGVAVGAAFDYLSLSPKNKIGGIVLPAWFEERYHDSLRITEHPVEANASITDHAFVEPCEVMIRCGWSNSSLAALTGAIQALFSGGAPSVSDYVSSIYSQLLALHQSRKLLDITTSKRQYSNMLIQRLQVETDSKSNSVLMVTAICRQVIVVSTQSTTLPPSENQADPSKTAETLNSGDKQLQSASPAPGGAVAPGAM